MTSTPDDETPLTEEQARVVARMRRLSLVSALIMAFGFAAVFGVIGYRLFAAPKSTGSFVDVTASLPHGARVVTTQATGDRLVVTIELGGGLEVHTFSLDTLAPIGRLRFATEP